MYYTRREIKERIDYFDVINYALTRIFQIRTEFNSMRSNVVYTYFIRYVVAVRALFMLVKPIVPSIEKYEEIFKEIVRKGNKEGEYFACAWKIDGIVMKIVEELNKAGLLFREVRVKVSSIGGGHDTLRSD